MTTRFIYTLSAEDVFYVGATAYPEKRRKQHVASGREGVLTVIEVVDDDWAEAERRWIAHFRERGAPLINKTRGGDGNSLGTKASSERLEKMRQWVRTPEMRERMSKSHLGKSNGPHSEETRRRIRASNRGKSHGLRSPEAREKSLAAVIRRWENARLNGLPTVCSEQNCNGLVHARGMCNMHYLRYIRSTKTGASQ